MHALQNLGIINIYTFKINFESRLLLLISLDVLSINQFYILILIFISYSLEEIMHTLIYIPYFYGP